MESHPLKNREGERILLACGLGQLAALQLIVSGMVPGAITDEVTNEQVTTTCFALSGEIFELAQELGWKNWKKNPKLTPRQVADIAEEFADVMAFLGMLLNLIERRTGLSWDDLAGAYFAKSEKNIQRFLGESGEEGYEGFGEGSICDPKQARFDF